MANEYLKRQPTSSGNSRRWTVSFWMKNSDSTQGYTAIMGAGKLSPSNVYNEIFYNSSQIGLNLDNAADPENYNITANPLLRDLSTWMHVIVSFTDQGDNANTRLKFYINGAFVDHNTGTGLDISETSFFNNSDYIHYIGSRAQQSAGTTTFDAQYFDVFLVDGQALTPDIFGFNKDGDGYISVGSTQSTDFRPGQWVPKAPRTIKSEINRRGGFGVNGFYLPMNDSSNFGADFHCAPNSIITLKGEDLPQPRNGAPTTSDAYVSELRTDPYAANLVLAVPGISTSTSANLITNGNFDSNISGWTTVQATTSWQFGVLRIIPNASVNGAVYQSITTEVGKRYTVTMEVVAAGAAHARLHVGTSTDIDSADKYTYTSGNLNNVGVGKYTTSFTPTTTTTIIWLEVGGGTQTQIDFDNVVVIQEDAPRDYSADIKGSGTNKTLTANGNAGVGYEIPSYYGSALTFDGSGDYLSQTYNADFNFGTDDFTVEMWVYPNTVSSIDGLFAVSGGPGGVPKMAFHLNSGTPSVHYNGLTGASDIYTASAASIPAGQWSHLAYTRKGTTWTWYINGVATGTGSNSTVITFTSQPYYIGYGGEGYFDSFDGKIQDLRIYKGVAKYKGGFDVPKPYTPVGIATWRAVPDTTANNFATWNPLWDSMNTTNNASFSDGNLKVTGTNSDPLQGTGTVGVSTGKWYYETRATANPYSGSTLIGIRPAEYFTSNAQNRTSYRSSGLVFNDDGSTVQSGTTYTTGDIIGVAFDMNTKKLWFSKNGSWVYSGNPEAGTNEAVSLSSIYTNYTPFFAFDNGSGTEIIDSNFGQNPTFSGNITAGTYTDSNGKGLFKYQPPSGFLALCEDNLPTPAIADPGEHFKTVLWTGVDGTNKIKCGFKPDLVWIKNRDFTNWHALYDSIRGPYLELNSNEPSADRDRSSNDGLRSFDSDGFTSGLDDNTGGRPGDSYVAWCWKAGGAAVANTSGSINSQVSVNQTAGFSIVSYTVSGTSAHTTGHGLSQAPEFILWKSRSRSASWSVYHKDIGNSNVLRLDTSAVASSSGSWNNTSPTSSVVSHGGYYDGDNIIYYAWHGVEGYSKFGSYIGNESADGPFVYCGFKPAFLLIKIASPSGSERDWHIYDSARNSTNLVGLNLRPSANTTEINEPGIDFLSNGFKLRYQYIFSNKSGGQIVFAAFAESPFQTANAK